MSRKSDSSVVTSLNIRRSALRQIDAAADLAMENRSQFLEKAGLERADTVVKETLAKFTIPAEAPA